MVADWNSTATRTRLSSLWWKSVWSPNKRTDLGYMKSVFLFGLTPIVHVTIYLTIIYFYNYELRQDFLSNPLWAPKCRRWSDHSLLQNCFAFILHILRDLVKSCGSGCKVPSERYTYDRHILQFEIVNANITDQDTIMIPKTNLMPTSGLRS